MSRLSHLLLTGNTVGALLLAGAALAVGTRTFELKSSDDFIGGDLQGVAVDSSGRVVAGLNLGDVPILDATAIWSMLPLADGGLLLATGNEGKLLRVDGVKVTVVADTDALVITSLARAWRDSVIMGTLPGGKVMRFEGGKVATLAALPKTEHVWQVAFDPRTGSVFAATGPEGKLWRIPATGEAQVYFDAEEQQLVSLAIAPDGSIYAGASDKAKLYHVTGPGRASVVYDFGRTEVRAIAVSKSGDVYAIANEIKSGASTPSPSKKGKDARAEPSGKTNPAKGKGTLYHFTPGGTPTMLLDDDKEHFVSLTLGADGKPYVGTGVEGRVYSIDEVHNAVLVADIKERQVSGLILRDGTGYVAGSDPAVLHPVRGIGGPDAVWTSKVLDAGIKAHFGRLRWVSTGALEFESRSGNTTTPDDTWSAWSAPMARPGVLKSPSARCLQLRARYNRDPKAALEEVVVAFVTDNLKALVTEVKPSKTAGLRSGIQRSGDRISSKPDSTVGLRWTVNNPDDDELRYRLQYRTLGSDTWFDLLKPGEKLTDTSYKWETADLPEGLYRVRVEASDELSNPPDLVQRHRLESGVIAVDNTAPVIEDLRIEGRRLRGVAVDGVGPIQRIELSVVGTDEWFPLFPADRIFDQQRETIDSDVSGLVTRVPAILAVRAYDDANNSVVRHLSIRR
ncbi:MAG: fibronectin type III domain-containing protein [Polyangiaceae bacterium]|nr:fibronectin type III domain-containing protein [Polyangiaceae bacterium]